MMRRMFSAAVVMLVVVGFIAAETHRGIIKKVSKGEVTIMVRKKGEKTGEEKTIKIAKDAKWMKSAGKGKKDKAEMVDFSSAIEKSKGKGAFGTVTTNEAGEATEITIMSPRKGGKGKKKAPKDS